MSSISAGTTTGTALVSTGDTTGQLDLKINGTTQAVRINTSGAIGVGTSPAFGTSGQVLTSGGSSAAPTWSDLPPGAGSFTATATGSIAAGAPVSVNSDGTVSTSGFVSGTDATVVSGAGVGSVVDFSSAQKPGTNFLVCAGRQTGVGVGFINVIPVSGTTFLPTVASSTFNNSNVVYTEGTSIVYEPVSDTFVIVYIDQNDDLCAQVASINFTTGSITLGTKVVLHTSTYYTATAVYTTSGKVFAAGWGGTGNLSGFVLTVSGTTITAGTRTDLSQSDTYALFSTYDTASGSVIVSGAPYDSGSVGYRPSAVAATISGTSVTFGSGTLIENVTLTPTINVPISYDTNANKTFVTYVPSSGQLKGVVLSVSGTTITVGTIAVLSGTDRTSPNSNIFTGVNNKTLCNFSSGSVHNFVTVSISGTTVTFDTPSASSSALQRPTFNSALGVLYYRSGGATLISVTPQLSNTPKFAGFSSASYTNGQTTTINSVGSANSSQTGLTAGLSYAVLPNGALGTSDSTSPSYAGIALSATKILVKG
jgi:hypothetical protein